MKAIDDFYLNKEEPITIQNLNQGGIIDYLVLCTKIKYFAIYG